MPARTSKRIDPFAALDAIMAQEVEPSGPEWFTVEQFASRYSRSPAAAYQRLKGLVKDGRVERWKGVSASNGRTTTKYRTKP